MENTVLILTNSNDGQHTDIVIQKIEELGGRIFRFDSNRLASGELQINLYANSDRFECEMIDSGKTVCSEEIKSVWYRRPNRFNFSIKDFVQKQYAENEIRQFLEGLWLGLRGKFWLNNPASLEKARKKIFQLELARSMGFKIPRTIVTNNPLKVKKFFLDCNRRIIFKAISCEFLDYGDKSFNIPTTLITADHFERLELIRNIPSLFQECLDKAYELRVTVVGKKIFSIKIDSQSNQSTMIDWRHPQFIDKLSYSLSDLPKEISQKCLTMLKKLNLVFGAFDFVVDTNGEFYFLEVNPNGQWYWLEHLTGVSISDAIANILITTKERR